MQSNKRLMDETSNAKSRLLAIMRDLTTTYANLVSSSLLKKQQKALSIEDVREELDHLKITKESKENEVKKLQMERSEKI
jgi:hypothetical protein